MLYRILRRLRRGRPQEQPKGPNLAYGHVLALQERVPELKAFGFQITPENASAIFTFYNDWLPVVREEARGAYLRTLLARLRLSAPSLSDACAEAIAVSDLKDGLPDRAQRLQSNQQYCAELNRQTHALEAAYGAPLVTKSWAQADRGLTLKLYLENHPEIFTGKDVLHIAPESSIADWMRSRCNYLTLDGSPDAAIDFNSDITELPIPDGSFDVVFCHRVLEHVLNDIGAMREMFRVLRPGGLLNMSVPQAVHHEDTIDWMVPDESHSLHVRHYGRDLTQRLESVGFVVQPVLWLCEQPEDKLRPAGAYPMRIYEGRRSL